MRARRAGQPRLRADACLLVWAAHLPRRPPGSRPGGAARQSSTGPGRTQPGARAPPGGRPRAQRRGWRPSAAEAAPSLLCLPPTPHRPPRRALSHTRKARTRTHLPVHDVVEVAREALVAAAPGLAPRGRRAALAVVVLTLASSGRRAKQRRRQADGDAVAGREREHVRVDVERERHRQRGRGCLDPRHFGGGERRGGRAREAR